MDASKICVNDYIKKIIINTDVVLDSIRLELEPLPQMVREPLHVENETSDLVCDGSYNNFIIPEPCGKCYSVSCYGTCDEEKNETEIIQRQLSFEEEMDLPPPTPLRRMLTNAHLPEDEPENEFDVPPLIPLRKLLTDNHLPEDEDNFDVPEGTQYISIQQEVHSDEANELIRETENA